MPLTYRQSLDQLLSLADFERKSRASEPPDWHLQRMGALLESLGDPHLAVPVVHVAGSKGKGSTSAMAAAVLRAAGYRTGLYISPHLHTFVERIQADGAPVSPEGFAGLVERLWPHTDAIAARGDLGRVSVFELLTAMAFVYFRDMRCEVAVVEVGLGGRLDATNLVRPAVSVITPISLDHVQVLGDTIARIAAEKAGIIKAGAPVVTGRQLPDARRVFEATAAQRGAPLIDAIDAVALESEGEPSEGPQSFSLRGKGGAYHISLPLLGPHQIDNARTAIAAVEALMQQGFKIRARDVEAGLAQVRWPGRAEVVSNGPPLVLADGAHNDASAHALVATLRRHFPNRRPAVFLFGGTSGHDYAVTARILTGEGADALVATQSRHPRAVDAPRLAADLTSGGVRVSGVEPSLADGLAAARRLAGETGIVVATGSLFVAAETIELVRGMEPELYPDLRGPYMRPYTAATV
jgi:dihydrofolate synthase/folylpolyglutamate synthase